MMFSKANPNLFVNNRWMEIAKSIKLCKKMSTIYNPPHTLVPIQGRTLSKTRIHTTYPMHFVIGYCFFYHILHMLVGINVAMFQLKTNYNHHKPILIDPTNSTLKQQPIISMDTPKQGKRGGNGWV
jgi:hypothetical protein